MTFVLLRLGNEITRKSVKTLILPGTILAVYTYDGIEDFYLVLCKREERT